MSTQELPIAIYYEHPDWFRPLFNELDRRGTPYVKLDLQSHSFDPGEVEAAYSLVFNRMSPSAYLRGRGHAIFYTLQYLAHLERLGVRVVNGQAAWRTEISKAYQLSLLQELGLPYPRARVIHRSTEAPDAAHGLRFPVVFKPNIGGSGAGVVRFDSLEALARAAPTLDLGIDHTALIQEFIPGEHRRIVRVEVVAGAYLYAIRIYTDGETFNLCPADVCQSTDGLALDRAACPIDAPRNGLRVEGYTPPPEIIDQVERIMHTAGIEVGGIEYMIDARDDRLYFYDINALSNFVADPLRIIGFDPFVQLADFLEREAARAQPVFAQEAL
ncbi:MAG: ATP-grasp domain-containing protein [Longimicrobiales bacterium]